MTDLAEKTEIKINLFFVVSQIATELILIWARNATLFTECILPKIEAIGQKKFRLPRVAEIEHRPTRQPPPLGGR